MAKKPFKIISAVVASIVSLGRSISRLDDPSISTRTDTSNFLLPQAKERITSPVTRSEDPRSSTVVQLTDYQIIVTRKPDYKNQSKANQLKLKAELSQLEQSRKEFFQITQINTDKNCKDETITGQADRNTESLTTQKSDLTHSQDEIDALSLGQASEKVRLVVGLPMPRSSQLPFAGHSENLNPQIQESTIPLNSEQKSRILMSRKSSDLTNQKWIQEFVCSIRAGSNDALDEELVRSILGKVAESELDVPSINKILKNIANATFSIASNEKLKRILAELQKPIQSSVSTATLSTEVATLPENLQKSQQESKSSSSIFVEGFPLNLPQHKKQNEVNRILTVLNGQQDHTRTLSVYDSSEAHLSEPSLEHLLTKHGHNLGIKDELPPNPDQKATKYKQVRTRVNGINREQFVQEAQALLSDAKFLESFPDISIRGIKGRGYVYVNPDYPGIAENEDIAGLFFGIHKEGKFQGQIKKLQPITAKQLKILQEQRRID